MTSQDVLFRRFEDAAVDQALTITSPDDLIGFFQKFRPHGTGLDGLLDGLPGGPETSRRLKTLFEIAGQDRRPDGNRDAYFIVRDFAAIDADEVNELARTWIESIGIWAAAVGDSETADVVAPLPRLRVLEGKPPKQPKQTADQSERFLAFRDRVPQLIHRSIQETSAIASLCPAFYFIACDAMLRDYLMWPLLADEVAADAATVDAGLSSYFELWKHGIKFRIIGDETIDFYIPRG